MIALSGSLILLGFGITILFWVLQTIYVSLTSPLKDVPGPWISRYTNLQLKFAVTGGRRIFYIDDLHKKYGPIVRISPKEVAVADPAAFKQIHA
ncbi:hypothetical protein KCU60_g16681, partial [Aureobasidium melanogenum]